jgi:hypothetical protein
MALDSQGGIDSHTATPSTIMITIRTSLRGSRPGVALKYTPQ